MTMLSSFGRFVSALLARFGGYGHDELSTFVEAEEQVVDMAREKIQREHYSIFCELHSSWPRLSPEQLWT